MVIRAQRGCAISSQQVSLCLIAIYLTLGSLIFLCLSPYLWALPKGGSSSDPGRHLLPPQNGSETQKAPSTVSLPQPHASKSASLWP